MGNQANSISDELLAAFMEGNTSLEETQRVLDAMASDEELQELIQLSIQIDEELEVADVSNGSDEIRRLPMLERAARNTVDNLCAIRCEGYALRALGIDVSDESLKMESQKWGWLKEEGTPLHYIGLLAGSYGLYVSRKYRCSLDDIIQNIAKGEIVIAVVDNTELKLPPEESKRNDRELGEIPNHAVVIKSVEEQYNSIEIFDPETPNVSKVYPIDVFLNAWDDSYNYLVSISNQNNYEPHPLDLDDVPIEPEFLELREAIAENAHEVWARQRKDEGWTFGPVRDDEKKRHPDMLPYDLLPESEKEYDRQMAINTIKLVKKLGWELKKRE